MLQFERERDGYVFHVRRKIEMREEDRDVRGGSRNPWPQFLCSNYREILIWFSCGEEERHESGRENDMREKERCRGSMPHLLCLNYRWDTDQFFMRGGRETWEVERDVERKRRWRCIFYGTLSLLDFFKKLFLLDFFFWRQSLRFLWGYRESIMGLSYGCKHGLYNQSIFSRPKLAKRLVAFLRRLICTVIIRSHQINGS